MTSNYSRHIMLQITDQLAKPILQMAEVITDRLTDQPVQVSHSPQNFRSARSISSAQRTFTKPHHITQLSNLEKDTQQSYS